jgi:hypothetical protein
MIFKFEFTATNSAALPRALALCKRLESFKETREDGAPLYSVKFEEAAVEAAQAIFDLVGDWKGAAFYIDDRLVPRSKIYWTLTEIVFENHRREMDERRRRFDVEDRLALKKRIRDSRGPGDLLKE